MDETLNYLKKVYEYCDDDDNLENIAPILFVQFANYKREDENHVINDYVAFFEEMTELFTGVINLSTHLSNTINALNFTGGSYSA